jgi:hypothetical protein
LEEHKKEDKESGMAGLGALFGQIPRSFSFLHSFYQFYSEF